MAAIVPAIAGDEWIVGYRSEGVGGPPDYFSSGDELEPLRSVVCWCRLPEVKLEYIEGGASHLHPRWKTLKSIEISGHGARWKREFGTFGTAGIDSGEGPANGGSES